MFCVVSPVSVKIFETRMHSSRMRTGRTLTVFRSRLFPGVGTCLVREGGVPAWSGGGVPAWSGTPPPVDRMTHACENITLAKTLFRPVINR